MTTTIRVATAADLTQINDIYNHYINHTAITFDVEPWNITKREQWFAKLEQWFAKLEQSSRYQVFVCYQGETLLGFAYNGEYRPKLAYQDSTEVTVYTAPNNTVKGVGTTLYQHLISHLKSHSFHRAYALITVPNPASIKLHLNYGFKQIGLMSEVGYKLEQHHDVALLEMRL